MENTRLVDGRARPSAVSGSPFRWPPAASLLLLPAVVAALLLALTPGCVSNPRLEQLHKGTSCSAENVQNYAAEHHLTYEQALAELRRQDEQLWAKEEARQKRAAGSRQQSRPGRDPASEEPSSL